MAIYSLQRSYNLPNFITGQFLHLMRSMSTRGQVRNRIHNFHSPLLGNIFPSNSFTVTFGLLITVWSVYSTAMYIIRSTVHYHVGNCICLDFLSGSALWLVRKAEINKKNVLLLVIFQHQLLVVDKIFQSNWYKLTANGGSRHRFVTATAAAIGTVAASSD